MLHTYSSSTFPQPESQHFRVPISPLRARRRVDHERTTSEILFRPRPISVTSFPTMRPTLQHSKRASIYVSDASVLLAQRPPMASPTSPQDSLLSPSNDASDFVDHYAILEIDPLADALDVTAAFRRLRVVYFQSDAKKYRLLQAAFDILRDPSARHDYDVIYHAHTAPSSLSSIGEVTESKHERKDSAMGDDATIREEEEAELALQAEEALAFARSQDPNWGLRHQQRLYEPILGRQPYQSWIPMPAVYAGRTVHPRWKCRRPTYTGQIARFSLP